MKMQLIKQRKHGDCGIACLAMMFNISYEEVIKFFPDNDFDNDGLSILELSNFISSMGSTPFESRFFDLKRKGILFVPSLNIKGGGHFVYWDGPGKLYDPSNKETYDSNSFPIIISHIIQLDLNLSERDYLIQRYQSSINTLKSV